MPFRNEPLVTIATFFSPLEASLARGALEAVGIRAMVRGEEFGYFTRYKDSPPQADLQVFESDRDRAMVELRRIQMRIVEAPDDSDS